MQLSSGFHIPQPNDIVIARCRHNLTSGRKFGAIDMAPAVAKNPQLSSSFRIPHPQSTISTGGYNSPAIGRKLSATDQVLMGLKFGAASPFARFHRWTALSVLTVSAALPSDENRALIISLGGVNLRSSFPLTGSHTRTILSSLTVSTCLPSNENCAAYSVVSWSNLCN